MFETAVFDSDARATGRRGWTTLASFALQIAGVGVLVLMPFIYTQALPSLRISEAPAPPHAPRMQDQAIEVVDVRHEAVPVSQYDEGKLVAPGKVPPRTDMTPDPEAPQINRASGGPGVPWGVPDTNNDARSNQTLNQILAKAVLPAGPDFTPVRTTRPSVLLEGNLVKRVEPAYPERAKLTHTQGQVVLHAVIDSDGRIVNLKATSGHPLLIAAAIDAVRQWRYRPYILNGVPIEVETQITVNFWLK